MRARQTGFSANKRGGLARGTVALLLCAAAGGAAAVNPLGVAVAGAPSLFVLAVGAADGENGAATADKQAADVAKSTRAGEVTRRVAGTGEPDRTTENNGRARETAAASAKDEAARNASVLERVALR